jgi:hypothetical protein
MEEDTFDLSLMEQSLKSSDLIDKEISRNFVKLNGYKRFENVVYFKERKFHTCGSCIKGPEYFLLLQTNHKKNNPDTSFFNSFGFNNPSTLLQLFIQILYLTLKCRLP